MKSIRLIADIDKFKVVVDRENVKTFPFVANEVGLELYVITIQYRPEKIFIELPRENEWWIPTLQGFEFYILEDKPTGFLLGKSIEWFDAYDENLNLIPKKELVRALPFPKDTYHLVVEILSMNEEGQVLITKRAKEKVLFPQFFEITGGSVIKGETVLSGAVRELREETGLQTKEENLIEVFREIIDNNIFICYLNKGHYKHTRIKLQKGETTNYKWIPLDDLKRLVKQSTFVPHIGRRILSYFDRIVVDTVKHPLPKEKQVKQDNTSLKQAMQKAKRP